MNEGDLKYRKWLEEEGAKVGSDGCTGVAEVYHHCCIEHDLAYRHHKDPRVAYLIGWDDCSEMKRSIADQHFKQCIQLSSPLKKWSAMAYWRYFAVRLAGWYSWKKNGSNKSKA